VFEEHERMVNINVWLALQRKEVPAGANIISFPWAMKKKSNGQYRARLNARGYA
jgi:hypothetical protein